MLNDDHVKFWRLKRAARLVQHHIAEYGRSLFSFRIRKNVKKHQLKYLESLELQKKRKIIIFFVPSSDRVTGGRLQIFSLYRISQSLFDGTDVAVLMCWLPGQGHDVFRVSGHRNDVTVCPFTMVLRQCQLDCEMLLHFPEFAAPYLCNDLLGWKWLRQNAKQRSLHINILNQNIDSMVNKSFVRSLQDTHCKVTITAAPSHWASRDEQDRMGAPIHWLPTWYYPDSAEWQPYETKRDLLIVSPDRSEYRDMVLDAIRRGLPDLEVKVIQGIPFEEYTELEKLAKWSITFGEGCDGFFYGPAMRGGVSFAVYNDTFAGWNTADWQTLYETYQAMATRIVDDIQRLDKKIEYEKYSHRLRDRFTRYRSLEALQRQLTDFYSGNYSLHPLHAEENTASAGFH